MASNSSDARQNHVSFPFLTNKIAPKNKALLYDNITSPNNASINRERCGNEPNSFTDGIFSSMSTYQMEFDVEIPRGRLPQCFVREFGDILAPFMMLEDPNHNEFEVRVKKMLGELFFYKGCDEGWSVIKDVYGLLFGAWVSFAYVNPNLLLIRLMTRWGSEVKYLSHTPPLKHLQDRSAISGGCPTTNIPKTVHSVVSHKYFLHSYVKKVTQYDIQSGSLILPWYGFGEFVFAFAYSDLILVDCTGERYPCILRFGVDFEGELACKLSLGWIDFCSAHGVTKGRYVRFCVPYPSHGYVMYVSIVPR